MASHRGHAAVTKTTRTNLAQSMNTIAIESKLAEKNYMLEREDSVDILKLTLENVAKVEAMIQTDSAYARSFDKSRCPKSKARNETHLDSIGSSAFWMTLLREALEDPNIKMNHAATYGEGSEKYSYDEILAGAIAAVDSENSTHLNSNGVGRMEMWIRLCSMNPAVIKQDLRDGTLIVFDKLSAEIRPIEKLSDRQGLNEAAKAKFKNHEWLLEAINASNSPKAPPKGWNPRTNISFASKFCHYACFYLFEGSNAQDNYSIYDNVLKKVLPGYLQHYKLSPPSNQKNHSLHDEYTRYREAIDKIRDQAKTLDGRTISRNGLDHLLWYYHKGRNR